MGFERGKAQDLKKTPDSFLQPCNPHNNCSCLMGRDLALQLPPRRCSGAESAGQIVLQMHNLFLIEDKKCS